MKNNKQTGIVTATPKISEHNKQKIKDALENPIKILQTHWMLAASKNVEYIKIND